MTGSMKLLCMMLIATVAVAPLAEAGIACGTVAQSVAPCLPYLTGKGELGGCCSGIKGLLSAATTTPDRQAVCNCLKTLAKSIPDINLTNAAGLPDKCGVSIPYQISPSTDCSKVA